MGLKKRLKVSRMVKMHSNEMEDINEVSSGEIFAIFGLDCATGDTLSDGIFKFAIFIKNIALFYSYILLSLMWKFNVIKKYCEF